MKAAGAIVQVRLSGAARAAVSELLVLRVGATLGAKVLERRGEHGLVMLAGAPVVAKLPDGVAEGARLRLQVLDARGDAVTLKLLGAAGEPAAAAAAAPTTEAAYALALPGGATARLVVDPDAGGEDGPYRRREARAVALRFDSPSLGRLDLRIAPGAVAVHASEGAPAEAARAAAGELRAAISAATGAPVQVTVHPRTETLDVRG
jgi:hypothetical protein